MSRIIGIDLGTTNSVVAYMNSGGVEVIPNSEGHKTTPSVVFYEEGEAPVVGDLAKRQLVAHPEKTVRSVKRLMGRRTNEAAAILKGLPYAYESTDEDEVLLKIPGRKLRPEDVSSHILSKMRETAEDFLGEEATQAVVTVPAHFNDSQRQATKAAAEQAGIEVLRIINEPTAAALAYGLNKGKCEKVAVFDFGGGTFDISILELDEDVFEVRSTNGNTDLGGDNIDELFSEAIAVWVADETGIDPLANPEATQRIREAAERAKCELSTLPSTTLSLPFLVADESGPKHFTREITRDEFEKMIQPVLEGLTPPCQAALDDAGLIAKQIDTVVLVGGSTRIPAVQRLVGEFFQREPNKTVNPDEAVAAGAAIQAGIISGDITEVLLLDVTPLSLGIEIEGGVFRTLISRNSSIPMAVKRRFTTTVNNQSDVDVHVLQGERPIAAANRTLAHLRLTGVSKAPAEVPEIEVCFMIDADGIMRVSAVDLTSGSQNEMMIESYSPSQDGDSQRLIEDADASADKDRDFVHRVRMKQGALTTQRVMGSFLDASRAVVEDEDLDYIKKNLFRLDVAIRADDMDTILESEAILTQIGEKYADIYYVHKLAEE